MKLKRKSAAENEIGIHKQKQNALSRYNGNSQMKMNWNFTTEILQMEYKMEIEN